MAKINLDKYSDQQLDAAHLFANKDTNGLTNAQIADMVGISERQFYRWLNADEEFLELLNHFAEMSMKGFVPELYQQLRKSVRNGSTRGMELALKQQGKLIDRKEVSGSLDVNASADGLNQEQILLEIEELKKKIEGTKLITEKVDAE